MKLQHRACKHGVKTADRLPLSKRAVNARVVNFWTVVLTSFDRQFQESSARPSVAPFGTDQPTLRNQWALCPSVTDEPASWSSVSSSPTSSERCSRVTGSMTAAGAAMASPVAVPTEAAAPVVAATI